MLILGFLGWELASLAIGESCLFASSNASLVQNLGPPFRAALFVCGLSLNPFCTGYRTTGQRHPSNKKAARKGGLCLARCVRDQAKRTVVLLRYDMKPTPRKPRIIIAHVDGSGTAATSISTSDTTPPAAFLSVKSNV